MKNIAFIIFLLFISICRAQDNNILFQNYNVSNGLSQNTVIRSLEDSNGVMWFCTRDGLNRVRSFSRRRSAALPIQQ